MKKLYWKDVLFQASGNTIAQIIGILGIPILTRLYDPEVFAVQGIFLQVVMLLTILITWRYEYFFPLLRDEMESSLLFRWILMVGIVMTFFFTILILLLKAFGVFKLIPSFDSNLSSYFYLAPVTALVVSISLSLQHESQRAGDFRTSAISEVYGKSCYVGAGIFLSFFYGTLGLLLTTAFSAFGKMYATRRYLLSCLRGFQQTNRVGIGPQKKYKSHALSMVSSGAILTLSGLMPVAFMGGQYGANALGQFTLVVTTIYLPSALVGAAVGNVFYQRAAQLWGLGHYDDVKRLWRETLKKLILLSLPIYTLLFVMSGWVYPLVFGGQWVQAGSFAQFMAISAFASFIAAPVDRLSIVAGFPAYLPVLHLLRLLVVALVLWVSFINSYTAENFVLFYSVCMGLVAISDLILCRILVSRKETT